MEGLIHVGNSYNSVRSGTSQLSWKLLNGVGKKFPSYVSLCVREVYLSAGSREQHTKR